MLKDPIKSKRTTLRDVAAVAGVSIKTASRALAGESGVSPRTLLNVKEAALKLDFRPNRMAQNLRTGKHPKTVALIIGDLSNSFYSEIASGVEEILRPEGYDLFIASSNEDEATEKHLVENFLKLDVAAIILVPASQDHFYLEAARQSGTAFVFLDRPPVNLLADAVVLDNQAASKTAIRHFFDHEIFKIAILADNLSVWTADQRVEGARKAYYENQLPFDEANVYAGIHDAEAAKKIVKKLLELPVSKRPQGILALNNKITTGALMSLHESGKKIPIVAFDDFDVSNLMNISVIKHEPVQMGKAGARLVLERLHNFKQKPTQLILSSSLIVREVL